MIRYMLLILIVVSVFIPLCGQTKAVWVTPWDMNSEQKIHQVVENIKDWGITDLMVEVRYRGDAFYRPNRSDSRFANPEPTAYILKENPELDALQLFLDLTRNTNIRVHAWVTVNVISTKIVTLHPQNHIYYIHPNWLTRNSVGEVIDPTRFEGAYIDPGIPDVQTYLTNVFSDLVANYDIAGLHLDYVRYPSPDYGYHPVSIARYEAMKDKVPLGDFQSWKELQIYNLVQRIGQSVKSINPDLIYSAAVVSGINTARNRYSQNWLSWLEDDIIDQVYVMAYQTGNASFENAILEIPQHFRDRVVVGLRAWSDDGSYQMRSLAEKTTIVPSSFAGLSFFSYGGIISRNYQSAVRNAVPQRQTPTQIAAIPTPPPPTPIPPLPTPPSPTTTQNSPLPTPNPSPQTPNIQDTTFPTPNSSLLTSSPSLPTTPRPWQSHPSNFMESALYFEDGSIILELRSPNGDRGIYLLRDLAGTVIQQGLLNPTSEKVYIPERFLEGRLVMLNFVVNHRSFSHTIDLMMIQ